MKKYCFDFIRESVLSWHMDVLEEGVDENMIELSTPMGIFAFSYAVLDPYGEEIEDLGEYVKQREEYVKKLTEEINSLLKKDGNNILDSLRSWLRR